MINLLTALIPAEKSLALRSALGNREVRLTDSAQRGDERCMDHEEMRTSASRKCRDFVNEE